MMSLWDALRMNMMISYQELVRTFPRQEVNIFRGLYQTGKYSDIYKITSSDFQTATSEKNLST